MKYLYIIVLLLLFSESNSNAQNCRNLFVYPLQTNSYFMDFRTFHVTGNTFQNEIQDYHIRFRQINKTWFYTLAAWSLTNISAGIYYSNSTTLTTLQYFWKGNIYWNMVNFGLASAGLLDYYLRDNSYQTFPQILKQQNRMENILILNIGLDVAYIVAGFLLNEKATFAVHTDRLSGYGTALSFQGSFLLLYDTAMFLSHKIHSKKKLNPLIDQIRL